MHILAISPGAGFEEGRWRAMLRSGINGLMIREKSMEAGSLLRLARWCREQAPQVELWINGRLDVALAAGCGLHAPEQYPVPDGVCMKDFPLSRPLHDLSQFQDRAGAAQLILSPVFDSPGKGPALGPEGLKRWLDGLPAYGGRLLALGGIDCENAAMLKHPRLYGVAMIRGLWEEKEPAQCVEKLRKRWAVISPAAFQ